jgi:hypothetical protein
MTHQRVKCRGDGAEGEDETAAFSPATGRYIRRQIWWLALAMVGVTFFGAASIISVLVLSPAGYVLVGWFILSLILAFDVRSRIITTFADERDKARNDRIALNQLVSARGRGAAGSADGRDGGYSLPSATVVPINGKRVR